jgi:glycosyltransferase involved in cell wall biosynthesis
MGLKILMITPQYSLTQHPLSYGGVGSAAYDLSKELARRGNEVTVVTSAYNKRGQFKTAYNLKLHYFPSLPMPPKDVLFFFSNNQRIVKILKQTEPDVVHDFSSAFSLVPWVSKMKPFVTTIHGSPQISKVRSSMSSTADHLRDIMFRLTHVLPATLTTSIVKPKVDAYVFVSKFCLEDTMRNVDTPSKSELASKSKVIYNGIDVESLARFGDRVKKEQGIEDESIVFIGRLVEYKGILYLLKAFKDVVKELTKSKLHIVGTGPLFSKVKEYIHENSLAANVILHGYLPRMKALLMLAKSKFLVHPSFYESYCVSIAEAYALGKPVVVQRAGYASEMVKDRNAGIIVNLRNERELANALISLLTDENLYGNLSCNAEKAARELFDIKVTARMYESLFEELLKQKELTYVHSQRR